MEWKNGCVWIVSFHIPVDRASGVSSVQFPFKTGSGIEGVKRESPDCYANIIPDPPGILQTETG